MGMNGRLWLGGWILLVLGLLGLVVCAAVVLARMARRVRRDGKQVRAGAITSSLVAFLGTALLVAAYATAEVVEAAL